MVKISKEEVLKIAEMSRISIHENEIDQMIKNLEEVLSYAERVGQIASTSQEPSNKNINVFREDEACKFDAQKVLAQAPCREEDFFVVPVIIESKQS